MPPRRPVRGSVRARWRRPRRARGPADGWYVSRRGQLRWPTPSAPPVRPRRQRPPRRVAGPAPHRRRLGPSVANSGRWSRWSAGGSAGRRRHRWSSGWRPVECRCRLRSGRLGCASGCDHPVHRRWNGCSRSGARRRHPTCRGGRCPKSSVCQRRSSDAQATARAGAAGLRAGSRPAGTPPRRYGPTHPSTSGRRTPGQPPGPRAPRTAARRHLGQCEAERHRQAVGVTRRRQQGVATGGVAVPGNVRCHDGATGGHTFEQHDAEGLPPERGRHQHVGRCQVARHVIVVEEPEPAATRTRRVGLSQRRRGRSVTGHPELGIGLAASTPPAARPDPCGSRGARGTAPSAGSMPPARRLGSGARRSR